MEWRHLLLADGCPHDGLFVSLTIRRAIFRLVPSVCGRSLPPLEGGPQIRLSHRIKHHAMAKQLPLSSNVLWTRNSPVICLICLSDC